MDLIQEARARWKTSAEATAAQRTLTLAAKKFRAGDQWAPALKISREGGNAIQGQPAQPPRPCLVVDRLSQPIRQISNIIKNADFGFTVLPNGGGADTATAEIFQGYLRRVQNDARNESPIEWAADQAIEGGIGWFRLRTDYVHTTWNGPVSDPAVFDQHVVLERIANNLAVYWDPAARKPTKEDARFLFVVEDLPRDTFIARYPKADLRGLDEFLSIGDMPGWVDEDQVRIAEYWRVTYQDRPFSLLEDGRVVEGKVDGAVNTRVMRTPVVKCDKITAVESLEQYDWSGSRIPVIPVIGEELNIDGKTLYRGIITEGMDAQRMVNYTYSAAMEIFALQNKKAPYVPGASVLNYQQVWQTKNLYNWSYIPYDTFDEQGRPLPAPILDTTEAPIQAAVALMRVSEEAIKATTSTGDASLGNSNPNERSGKALQALQAQSELANSNYPDNVRRAIIYAAELICEVAPKITRPGQIVHLLGADNEPDQVMVGQPFAKGADGVPQPVDGVTPEQAKLSKGLHQFYDLNQGNYAVTVTVGKASTTRREEGSAAVGALIPHLPPAMAAVATPEYIEQLSFPGAQHLAEKLRKALPPELQQQEEGGPQPLPPQVQAMLQQLQQQNQQMQQAIQTDSVKAQATLQAAQIKAQADLERAKFEAQKEIHLQQMKDATSIEVARINAAKAVADTQAAAQEEAIATGIELQHDSEQAAQDRAHEVFMSRMGQLAKMRSQEESGGVE